MATIWKELKEKMSGHRTPIEQMRDGIITPQEAIDQMDEEAQAIMARNKAEEAARSKEKPKSKSPTPQSILDQMSKLVEEAQAEIAKMEKSNEAAEGSGGLLILTYSPEFLASRTGEINAALQEQIDTLRAEAQELVEDARKQCDVSFYQATQQLGPQTPEAWAEASARAQFVRLDLAQMAPGDVMGHYNLAKDAGDILGSWLIATEGLSYLDKVIAETTSMADQIDARQAGDNLNQALYGEAYTDRKTALAELDGLSNELQRPITPGEKHQWQTDISDKFGVEAEHVPA